MVCQVPLRAGLLLPAIPKRRGAIALVFTAVGIRDIASSREKLRKRGRNGSRTKKLMVTYVCSCAHIDWAGGSRGISFRRSGTLLLRAASATGTRTVGRAR